MDCTVGTGKIDVQRIVLAEEERIMILKKIILFGTGKYFDNYMISKGIEKRPCFAVDNDSTKIGTFKAGIEIKSPESLIELPRESFYVIICNAKYQEIAIQLESMGIYDYQNYTLMDTGSIYVPDRKQGEVKPYKIGYVPGVFDLFHVGHLNLLRNSKSRCEYLIAGVLTDELVEHFKGKRPNIPFVQRAEILEFTKVVDRVVPVDFNNTCKIDAWKRYHFDCHFSGNDHGSDWDEDLRQLREVGSNMEFFQYTLGTSSTQIKKKIATSNLTHTH